MHEDIKSWFPLFAFDHVITINHSSHAKPPECAPILDSSSFVLCWMGYFGQTLQRRMLDTPLAQASDGRDYLSFLSTSVFDGDAADIFNGISSPDHHSHHESSLRDHLIRAFDMSCATLVIAPLSSPDEFCALERLLALSPAKGEAGLRILFLPDVDQGSWDHALVHAVFDGVVHTLNVAPERYPFRSAVKQTVLSPSPNFRTSLELWAARRGWIARPFANVSMAGVRQCFNEARVCLRHDSDFEAVHVNFISDEVPGQATLQDVVNLVSSVARAEMLVTHSQPVGPTERSGIELGWFAPLRHLPGKDA